MSEPCPDCGAKLLPWDDPEATPLQDVRHYYGLCPRPVPPAGPGGAGAVRVLHAPEPD